MASPRTQAIFIGINGTVLALDRSTGTELWRTALKGSDFVNVLLDGGDLFATTKGELFCMDPSTGHLRWRNELKGLGRGLVTMGSSSDAQTIVAEAKRRRDQQAAAAGA